MSTASEVGRKHLLLAERRAETSYEGAIAAALMGLLAVAVESIEGEEREENLSRLHTAADDALGRVLELADTLAANPRATLKPTAFGDLATKIREAVDGPSS